MLISILSSCGVKNTNSSTDTKTNTETSTDSNTETETDTSSDTNTSTSTETNSETETNTDTSSDTNTNTSTDTDVEVEQSEKQANQVYFSYEKKENNYYPEIRYYEEIKECFEIPKDIKKGAYLKFIDSYEELQSYISTYDLVEDVFTNNYVVCVRQFFYGYENEKKLIGYYDLESSNDEYSISLDHYESIEILYRSSISAPNYHTTYIIVPKTDIVYSDQIEKISVNGKESLTDEEQAFDKSVDFHWYVENSETSYTLPKNPTSWVVNTDSELQRKLGLNFDYIYNLENPYRVILYLPNEPECDFLITKKEIKNGDLYLTVEKYAQHTNEYLENNDVLFYDLYIEDTSLLSENYNVFISIENVFAPAAVEVENIDAGEAILIAQEHFYSTYYSDELPGTGYRARYVHFRDSYIIDVDGTEEVENLEPVWIVRICSNELADSDDIKYNEAYTYYISSTGKIIKTDEPW